MSEPPKKETIDTPYGPLRVESTEGVRQRPGMYIGSTTKRGLHRLIWMFLKSDPYRKYRLELPASYEICLNADGSFSVKLSQPFILPEYAREREQTPGDPTLFETMMTKMVVRGKVSELLIPNALSEWAWAAVIDRDNGKVYRQDYRQGIPQGPLGESQDAALNEFGEEWSNIFCFKPDPEIFDGEAVFSYDYLFSYTRNCALLTPGLKIGIADRRDPRLPQLNTFLFEEGKSLLLAGLNYLGLREEFENANPYHPKYPPIIAKGEAEGVKVQVELYFQESASPALTPALFVNNDNMPDYSHGVDAGLWEGLLPPLNEYARQTGLLQSTQPDLSKAELAPGLVAIFNLKVGYPRLNGPGKYRFANPEAKPAVAEILTRAAKEWLEAHPAEAKRLVEGLLETRKKK